MPAYHRRNLPPVVITLLAGFGRHDEARRRLDGLAVHPVGDDPEADMQTWRAQAAVLLAEGDAAGAMAFFDQALSWGRNRLFADEGPG